MAIYARNTSVPVDRSKQEIERILVKYGADQFQSGWRQDKAAIMFRMKGRFVRIMLPLPDRKKYTTDERYNQAMRQRYRALVLSVKAKLESVEAGIETFEQAFMPHLVLPNGTTVGEHTLPQIEQAYQSGKMPAQLPGW